MWTQNQSMLRFFYFSNGPFGVKLESPADGPFLCWACVLDSEQGVSTTVRSLDSSYF